jgi:hypothetical protein
MIEVTLWYSLHDNKWSFNHLEYGHNSTGTPTHNTPKQESAWKNTVWKSELKYATDSKPIVIIE